MAILAAVGMSIYWTWRPVSQRALWLYWDVQAPAAEGTIDAYLTNDDAMRFELRQTPQLEEQRVRLRRTTISGTIPPSVLRESQRLEQMMRERRAK